MADQRCPMCGKANPADAEACEFCGARIKPLIIKGPGDVQPAAGGDPLSASSESESSLPDWLQSLKPEGESDFGAQDESLPDWLNENKSDDEPFAQEEGLPDWLKGDEEAPEPAPAEEESTEPPAWLRDSAESPEPEGLDYKATKAPDWVAPEESAGEEPQAPEDWLSSIRDQGSSGIEDAFATGEPEETEPAQEQQGFSEDDTGVQFDDWLSTQASKNQSEPEPASSASEGEPEETEDTPPDWLQRIRSRREEEEEEPSVEDTAGETEPGTIPDWLAGVQIEPDETQEAATPDWLSSTPSSSDEPEPAQPAGAIPDWLKDVTVERGEEQPSQESASQADDWLSQIERSAAFSVDSEAEIEDLEPAKPAEEVPEWLSKLEGVPSEKPTGSVPALIFDSEDELGPFSQDEGTGKFETPEIAQEPDWISHVPLDEAQAKKPALPEGTVDENLERADLPGWLEAMRPVEAAAPMAPLNDETSATVETSGPLQGMRGALPAQPAFGRLRKPPVQSLKLAFNENQKSHIALLEGLLSNESEGRTLPKPSSLSSQALIRLVIAAIMIVSVLGPLWFPQGLIAQPALTPNEIQDANRSIASIAPGDPVLVAFDYEASLAGEVEPAASALMNQLAAKNATITAVSTNISGPILAARWLETYNQQNDTTYGDFYNLGYIPAGAAGLSGFAANPRSVMPYDLQQKSVWNNGSLITVQSIADYHLVVVLTDNAENAKIWIEQIQPLLRGNQTPLVLASSAQVEPIIRPYYDNAPNRQVNGFVAGLAGGAAFERETGVAGSSGGTWDSFGIGLLVAALIILGGGIVNGVLATIAMVKKPVEEEEQ